jgi:hypothetical protein
MKTIKDVLIKKINNIPTKTPPELLTRIVEYFQSNNTLPNDVGNVCIYDRSGLSEEITAIVYTQENGKIVSTSFTLNLMDHKIGIDKH